MRPKAGSLFKQAASLSARARVPIDAFSERGPERSSAPNLVGQREGARINAATLSSRTPPSPKDRPTHTVPRWATTQLRDRRALASPGPRKRQASSSVKRSTVIIPAPTYPSRLLKAWQHSPSLGGGVGLGRDPTKRLEISFRPDDDNRIVDASGPQDSWVSLQRRCCDELDTRSRETSSKAGRNEVRRGSAGGSSLDLRGNSTERSGYQSSRTSYEQTALSRPFEGSHPPSSTFQLASFRRRPRVR
jgi:hypothetical protein